MIGVTTLVLAFITLMDDSVPTPTRSLFKMSGGGANPNAATTTTTNNTETQKTTNPTKNKTRRKR
jgi:hypothetical protein